MMTSCFPLPLAAVLLLGFHPVATATSFATEASQKASPVQPPAQTPPQTQPAPVFSLGTISIAPSPQRFAGQTLSGSKARKAKNPRPHHTARNSRGVIEPVPFRTYSRI